MAYYRIWNKIGRDNRPLKILASILGVFLVPLSLYLNLFNLPSLTEISVSCLANRKLEAENKFTDKMQQYPRMLNNIMVPVLLG